MGPEWLELLATLGIYVGVTWVAFHVPVGSPGRGPAPRTAGLLRLTLGPPRRRPPEPARRPLELIALDARRLGHRFHHPPRGTSYAKQQAVRHAYDHVLVEACAALEVEQLIGVLSPGDELDAERRRVENLLWLAGLRLDSAA